MNISKEILKESIDTIHIGEYIDVGRLKLCENDPVLRTGFFLCKVKHIRKDGLVLVENERGNGYMIPKEVLIKIKKLNTKLNKKGE